MITAEQEAIASLIGFGIGGLLIGAFFLWVRYLERDLPDRSTTRAYVFCSAGFTLFGALAFGALLLV